MVNYNIFFHIGYPKAASTSLQKSLFPNHSEINDLSKHAVRVKTDRNFRSLYEDIKKLEPDFYNKKDYLSLLNYIVSYFNQNKLNIFSDEGMLNQFFDSHVAYALKANRIKSLFPNSKIIIVIREQSDLLRSFYDYHFPNLSIDKWLSNLFEKGQQSRLLESLDFYKVISFYQNIFGSDSIKILCFEDLKFNPDFFSKELSNFMGINNEETIINIKTNPINTYNNSYTKFRRLRKKIFPTLRFRDYFPNFLVDKSKKQILKILQYKKITKSNINEDNLIKINDYYKISNQNLMKLTGLNLEKYNYPL